jgi:glucose uptake protein GlcU
MTDATQLVLPSQQVWVVLIGALVPLLGYAINKWGPWKSEQVKGIVQVVLAALGGVAYSVVFGDVKGADSIVQQSITAVVAALFAHKTLWAPSGINLKFGASPPQQEVKPGLNPAPAAPVAAGGTISPA